MTTTTTKLTEDEVRALQLEVISDEEIATLNEARTILERLNGRGGVLAYDERVTARNNYDIPYPHGLGRFSEACELATTAIFNALVTANSHCHRPMTYLQLHNREATA